MSARTQLAYLAAGLVLVLGLFALINPLVAVRLVGLEVVEPRGLTEVRALLGAFFLALGGLMLWAVPTRPRSSGTLRLAALLWSAVVVGRLLSIVLDAAVTPGSFLLLGFDLVVALGAFLGSTERRTPRRGAVTGDEAPDPLRAYRS